MNAKYVDVVILGGGHNGLVAAAYLALAGLRVQVIERSTELGGAAVSVRPFAGVDVNLSRYSYLLSLFPSKIMKDLGLTIASRQRQSASYSPMKTPTGITGLHISNANPHLTEQSFLKLTGGKQEFKNYLAFNEMIDAAAEILFPSMLKPSRSRSDFEADFYQHSETAKKAWQAFVEEPLGNVIESMFAHDLVRGTVFTDGKIGVLTSPHDESLLQNRTFLYHVVGTDWRVPVGGMGALSSALAIIAQKAGASLLTNATVTEVLGDNNGGDFRTHYIFEDQEYAIDSQYVLSNVAPLVLEQLFNGYQAPDSSEGAVFKVNLVLDRLPKIKDTALSTEEALSGTFHIDEGYQALLQSFEQAVRGDIPAAPPGEMYCHSLTDASIVGDTGYHTLTLFGLDMPYRIFVEKNDFKREFVLHRYLAAINHYFEEPIEECIARDANGELCIEAKSPLDIEQSLNMPTANIFHNDPSWFWGEEGQWGVETGIDNLYLCGSGALRGGAVSGIPGHNAAMKVLEALEIEGG